MYGLPALAALKAPAPALHELSLDLSDHAVGDTGAQALAALRAAHPYPVSRRHW